MTREFRLRSSCAILRVRIASIMRCRSTGCSADSIKKIQKRSSTDMRLPFLVPGVSAPHEIETQNSLIGIARPVGPSRVAQRRGENVAGDEAADVCPPGDRAAG